MLAKHICFYSCRTLCVNGSQVLEHIFSLVSSPEKGMVSLIFSNFGNLWNIVPTYGGKHTSQYPVLHSNLLSGAGPSNYKLIINYYYFN